MGAGGSVQDQGLIGDDYIDPNEFLKYCPNTSSLHTPTVEDYQCLNYAQADEHREEQLRQLTSAKEVIITPSIADEQIRSWDHQLDQMKPCFHSYLIMIEVDKLHDKVFMEFVPFESISDDVFAWSYRWATPVEKSELRNIEIYEKKSNRLLYRTVAFDMELEMLEQDIQLYKKVWMDKISIPQKSQYTGVHVAAMGKFYSKVHTILREVRRPTGLPMHDYLSRAWTYQEARYGRTMCDKSPSIFVAKEWAEMVWGRQFVVDLSGLLYEIPNIMARTMDVKKGPNNITFAAMRNCIGSGRFFTFFVKRFREHEKFPTNRQDCKALGLLEKIGLKNGQALDKALHEAFRNLKYERTETEVLNGEKRAPTLIGPTDCRLDPQCTGALWQAIVAQRSEFDLSSGEECVPEAIAEMSLRTATFQSDRFIGTFAVVLQSIGVAIELDPVSRFPDPSKTWTSFINHYKQGLFLRRNLGFMLYGLPDFAGMVSPSVSLPTGILSALRCSDQWEVRKLLCERVVSGIGDGTVNESRSRPDLRNAWAIHVSEDNEEISLLIRKNPEQHEKSEYYRVLVVGRRLGIEHKNILSQFCGLFMLGCYQLLDVHAIAASLQCETQDVMTGMNVIAAIFRDFMALICSKDHLEQPPQQLYSKHFGAKFCIPAQDSSLEMTALRETAFLNDKMSKVKEKRSWTRREELDVIFAV